MKHSYLYILAGTLALSSCGLYGHYQTDTQRVNEVTDGLYRDPAAANSPLAITDSTSFGTMPWYQVFTDDKLQALISKALEQNYDLQKMQNTLKTANIGLKLSKLQYLPQIALSPSGTISKVFDMGMDNTKVHEEPLQASWQLDPFGVTRNSMKQSELQVTQAVIAKQAAKTGIICGMANLYYGLQMLDEQLATTKATLEIWNKQIEVMEAYKTIGYTNSVTINSAKAQIVSIESSIVNIEDQQRKIENNICLLMGETPHAIERNAFTAEGFPTEFSTGVPLSLLANRPDVAIAEAQLASCSYGVMKAKGQMCPQITISGAGKFTNSLGSMISNPGKFIAAGVASLTQPIFARGQLLGNLQMQKVNLENAQLDFEKSLINAGMEVSNALAAYHSSDELIANSEEQVRLLDQAYSDTEFLWQNGNTTTYLEILSARMNLLQAKLGLINNRYSKVINAITLYQALGGGSNI